MKLDIEKDKISEVPIDFSNGIAFWTAENDYIICYFISENIFAGPGMKVDIIKPITKYFYIYNENGKNQYNLTSGIYENGTRIVLSGPDVDGQLALFDVDHQSPRATYMASNKKFLIYSFYFLTYISFISKAIYGESIFIDINISSHAEKIVNRFIDVNVYRFQDIKNINDMSRKDFLDFTISSPVQMIKEDLIITQISNNEINFAKLLAKDAIRRY